MLAWIGSLLVSILPHHSVTTEVKAPEQPEATKTVIHHEAEEISAFCGIDGSHWP